MNIHHSASGRLTRCGALAILGLTLGALAFGPAFSNAQPDEPKQNKDRPFGKKGKFRYKGNPDDQSQKKEGAPKKEGPGLADEELAKARQELERARQEAEKAVQRVRELQELLEKAAGERRAPIVPKNPAPAREKPERERPKPPMPPFGRGPGSIGGPDREMQEIQEMKKQLVEMKQMIEEMRNQLRGSSDAPKDSPMGRGDRRFGGPGGFPPGGRSGFDRKRADREKEKDKLPPPREKKD